jgi:uncharacterized protein
MPGSAAVGWSGGTVTARVWERGTGELGVLLAHGAGTGQDHPLVAGLAGALADAGLTVVTFNYPFTEAGRRRPDPAARLLEVHASVLDWVIGEIRPRVVMGGRSMGGRMATMLAAEGAAAEGLVLYAYPLHPAGRPDRLRIDHLPAIRAPMLFFQGSRDALSTPDLFDRHVRSLPGATVIDLEGADHSFRIPGASREEVNRRLAADTSDWIGRHFADRPGPRA